MQPVSSPAVFEVKLDKDRHGLGITIAGYTDPTGMTVFLLTAHQVLVLSSSNICNKLSILCAVIFRDALVDC